MRIGIDASRAFLSQRTGIEEYSYQIIKHLRSKLKKEEVFLYLRKNQKVDFDLPDNWKTRIIKFPYFWTQIGLSLEMFFHPVDVLFIPAHTVPIIHPKNSIVAVHGLEYEFFPEGYSFLERLYMRMIIKLSCRWSKGIVAVSKNTKKDLVEVYKIPEKKIEVMYEGISEKYQISNLKYQKSSKLQIKNYKPYLLFIGRLEKRKNIEGIIDAYEILKVNHEIPHRLVLAGKPGYGYESIKHKVESSKYKADIIETGFISEEDKNNLLRNADVFLFPTFYEGFGLPVLEAQNLGVPVVASNVSSLPEVGGDAAAYCDPNEPETIADAAHKILDDEEYRNMLKKKGCENADGFSWDKCTKEISGLLIQNIK